MRYLVTISSKNVILTQHQLDMLLIAVQGADLMDQKHVGAKKGSQGYDNAYTPTIETKPSHEWLQASIVTDDFVDAVKLTMRLDKDET